MFLQRFFASVIFFHLFSLLISLTPAYAKKSNEDADDGSKGFRIAKHCQDANKGYKGEFARADLVLETQGGGSISRQLEVKRREPANDEGGDQSLLLFLLPTDVKGTKLLTWSHFEDEDDQWVYLPSYGRVKRISSRLKTGSFMGSEFSYEDLGGRDVGKFKHKFIKNDVLNGRKAWVLDQQPKDRYSGYSKQTIWLDFEYKNPIKVEYYDRKGDLFKVANFEGYKKHDQWWRPGKVVMRNVQNRKKSTMVWKDIEFNKRFPSKDFEKEYLKN